MPPAVESQSTLGSPPNFYFSELIQQLAVDMMSDNPQYVIGDFSTKGILSYIVKMNHQSKEINTDAFITNNKSPDPTGILQIVPIISFKEEGSSPELQLRLVSVASRKFLSLSWTFIILTILKILSGQLFCRMLLFGFIQGFLLIRF